MARSLWSRLLLAGLLPAALGMPPDAETRTPADGAPAWLESWR